MKRAYQPRDDAEVIRPNGMVVRLDGPDAVWSVDYAHDDLARWGDCRTRHERRERPRRSCLLRGQLVDEQV